MKRRLPDIDYLSSYYETKENLESAHKRQRIFAHPTSKSKLLRQDMYQFIDNHNANIDTQISDEINKLIVILKDVIIDNNIHKLQELISHGILDELNSSCHNNNNHNININNNDMNDIKNVITEIIGCILQFNREECLLIIAPWIQCKYFDINKFDKPILNDPYKIILFLHSNSFINLTASHCKLFHKCCQYGHYQTIKYCLDKNVPVHSCENRAIRDAARYGHLNIVKLLHESGGNIHQYQDECLRKAARHGHLDVLKYLINNNGNIHSRNSQALIRSVENGHCQCSDLLIKSGLLKNENLLITKYAIKHKQYNCLSLLLRYGYILYDTKLRELALTALYGHNNNNNNNNNVEYEISDNDDEDIDLNICLSEKKNNNNNNSFDSINYETESSVSPPLSPQYLSATSSSLSLSSSNNNNNNNDDRSPIIGNDEILSFQNEDDINQRFLDAISEGLALRETMLISVLTQFIYHEIAYIICLYEKLALTEEDQHAVSNYNNNKNKYKYKYKYKR